MGIREMTNGDTRKVVDLGNLTPKQLKFCKAKSRYIAYGGARGGGKSHVLRVKAIGGALRYPGIKILVVRRTYPDLENSLIQPMVAMIPPLVGTYNGTMHMLTFSNGSFIKFGHYSSAADNMEYQGKFLPL